MTEFYLAYAPHDSVAEFEKRGWTAREPTPGHHGVHSRVMKWERQGEPDYPRLNEEGRS